MLRHLLRVARHTALAFVVVSLLGALALQTAALSEYAGSEHDAYPYHLELRLSEGALPVEATAPLLAEVQRDVTTAADVQVRADGTWLVVRSASEEDRAAANRALGDLMARHGFTQRRFRLTSTSRERLIEWVTEPLTTVSRFSSLIPVIAFLGSAGFAGLGWYFRRRYPQPGWEAGTLSRGRAAAIGIGVGVAGVAVGEALGLALQAAGAPVQEQDWVVRLAGEGGATMAALGVLGVAVAPLAEELFFRGHVFRELAANGLRLAAYLYSAGVFAVAHSNNPAALPVYFAAGVILGWSFDRWRTLTVPIAAHATVNAVGIGLLIWR